MMKLTRMMKNRKGFTLVELMVVVIIIGILVAIAIPLYGSVTKNAANKAHDSNVRILKGAGQMYIAAEGLPTSDLSVGTELDEFIETPLANMEIPKNSDATGTGYTVTVKADGTVVVSPGFITAPASGG